jgi:Family of unknown function (DUF6338)
VSQNDIDPRRVVLALDDGSAVRGLFGSFNISADDSPDRDLILKEPIFYRPPGETAREVLWDMSAVCCPARRIVALFVVYSDSQQRSATPVLAQPDPETSAVSAEQSEAVPSLGALTLEPARSSHPQQSSGPLIPRQDREAE